jgi:DNA-binding HxlR family transcriptional regulator
MPRRRSYDQFCGLARALDIVGDRWALLIIRELLIGPRRYSDLKAALPGAASNLLVQRLRDLRDAGVVSSRTVPAPTPATLHELTPLGLGLEQAVVALTAWGGHCMVNGKRGDLFHADWLIIAFRSLLGAKETRGAPRSRFLVDGVGILIDANAGTVETRLDSTSPVDVEVMTDGETALAIVSGTVSIASARRAAKCRVSGKRRAVQRLAQLFQTQRAG